MYTVRRLLVISDMHGEIDAFNALLDEAGYNPDKDLLFLLGDYIDRGTNPKAVIEKARALERCGAIALKGNHEDMMEKALVGRTTESFVHWAANGAEKTLSSYGLAIESVFKDAQNGSLQLPEDIEDDLHWIRQLHFYAQTEHYLFVHAGVDPEKPLEKTEEETFLWIRTPFLTGYSGKKTVIFGHTPTMNLHETNDVYFGGNNIIGIDGGCVFGGQLNCLELPSKETYHVRQNK
ncbi:serine/threonine protein phosphatase [Sporolactobacillus sp. THM7-7]|nr:serine/threonine protein phosphatase [Sporolactobacillus sp. THM7-7]